ncbi:MAG: hypothetical protein M1821_004994 [Bathelium mastoideum]|nr:MAG: hypothetical protein M1821_004994 [Bathelium mastoideum]
MPSRPQGLPEEDWGRRRGRHPVSHNILEELGLRQPRPRRLTQQEQRNQQEGEEAANFLGEYLLQERERREAAAARRAAHIAALSAANTAAAAAAATTTTGSSVGDASREDPQDGGAGTTGARQSPPNHHHHHHRLRQFLPPRRYGSGRGRHCPVLFLLPPPLHCRSSVASANVPGMNPGTRVRSLLPAREREKREEKMKFVGKD